MYYVSKKGGNEMKKGIVFDKSIKVFPMIVMAIGIVLALALLIMRLNLVAVVNVAFMCIVVALMMLGIFIFKKLYISVRIAVSSVVQGKYRISHLNEVVCHFTVLFTKFRKSVNNHNTSRGFI